MALTKELLLHRKAQLEYKLKVWKFGRNLDKALWRKVARAIETRKRAGRDESEVIYNGRRVNPARVRRAVAMYRAKRRSKEASLCQSTSRFVSCLSPRLLINANIMTVLQAPAPSSSSDQQIAVGTPPSISLEFGWPITLPWLIFQSALASGK